MTLKKLLAVGGLGALALLVLAALAIPAEESTPGTAHFGIRGQITKAIYDENGNLISLETKPNVITNAGLDHIKYLVGQGLSSDAVIYIALGNGTSPTATSTTLDNEWTTCGLSRTAGTFYSNGVGNWTISASWTSTCDGAAVNTTAIFNATSGGTMFAGDTFSSTDTLNKNYQLVLNWTFWVTYP